MRIGTAREVAAEEALEDVRADLWRDPRSLIADGNGIAGVRPVEVDAYRAAGGRVSYRVVEQVDQHPPDQVLVPGERRRGNRHRIDRDIPRRGDHTCGPD